MLCECSKILDIAIDLAKKLKETEFTVAKPLEIDGQGKNLLWGPYDSRQGEVRRARSRARRDRFENGSEGGFRVNVFTDSGHRHKFGKES